MMRIAKLALFGALLTLLTGLTPTQKTVLFSGSNCVQAQAFINRTTGLDSKHAQAYRNLICSLVNSGVWVQLDVLYVFATQTSTIALTNLVSSSFTATPNGGPTFTADQGYAGVANSTTVYLDTGFDPAVAPSPHYVQNAAHAAVWVNTDSGTATSEASIGWNCGSPNAEMDIFPRHSDGKSYFRINDNAGAPSAGITEAHSNGFYVANRSAGSVQQGDINAIDQGVISVASNAYNTSPGTAVVLAARVFGTGITAGSSRQHSAASIGGILSPVQVSAFYTALAAYRIAIGLSP